LKSTQDLKNDHVILRRIKDIAFRCSELLYDKKCVPIEDIEIISVLIEEFVDLFHHGKEEKAYFPETKENKLLAEDVRKFLIEHEFGRRIAIMLKVAISNLKKSDFKTRNKNDDKKNLTEPVARFLRTYAIFIEDHTGKEDLFFDKIEEHDIISEEEDKLLGRLYETCKNHMGGQERVGQLKRLIEYLEGCEWMKKS
jgi:hemerythrin-like domain-containing protein